jgi:hypothetical protein
MPIKLKKKPNRIGTGVHPQLIQAEDASGGGPPGVVMGLIVNKDVIKTMVQTYRTKHAADPNCLKFIHFNLYEVFQLFIANGILSSTDTVANVLTTLPIYGLKIYLGNHYDLTTCPEMAEDPNPYLNMDTAIVCNTKLDIPSRTWIDLLVDSNTAALNNSVTIAGMGTNTAADDGLDRGSLCPPNCPPATDPQQYGNQDVLTTP